MDADDQNNIPSSAEGIPGGGEPSPGEPLSDESAAAMLGHWISTRGEWAGGMWQPPSPEELQRDFPQFEIRGVIGRGGMGAIYKAWQHSLERFVAIKILPPGLYDDSGVDVAERFKREAKAMAQLRHNGIVAVYDSGQTAEGLHYFVMEYVDGTDVHRLVKERGRIEPSDVAREPEHPVAGASWDEANAFCKWLTEKETAAGKLRDGARYRLPTDEEWSRAVGLASEVGATPKERTGYNGVDFPWGTGFPPPDGTAGNYADSAFHEQFPTAQWVEGYADGFATTAPVGVSRRTNSGCMISEETCGNGAKTCTNPAAPSV